MSQLSDLQCEPPQCMIFAIVCILGCTRLAWTDAFLQPPSGVCHHSRGARHEPIPFSPFLSHSGPPVAIPVATIFIDSNIDAKSAMSARPWGICLQSYNWVKLSYGFMCFVELLFIYRFFVRNDFFIIVEKNIIVLLFCFDLNFVM